METSKLKELFLKVKTDKRKKMLFIAGCTAIVVLLFVAAIFSRSVIEVSVNGQTLGNLQSYQKLNEIKEQLEKKYEEKLGTEVKFADEIKALPVKAIGKKLDSDDEMMKKLESALTYKLKAVAIEVGEKEVAIVKDKTTAESVLNQVKQYYISQTPGELVKAEIAEKVNFTEKFVEPKALLSAEDAKNLILKGAIEIKTYEVVEGDSLWSISQKEKIPLDDLIKANPQLKSEDELALGDKINLTEVKPLLNVTVVKKITYSEAIPYETEVQKDSTMWTWDQKVKQAGENGTKEIAAEAVFKNGVKVSQTVISEKVVKEPVNRIVAKGTKAEVAFRGSGRFSWPVVGQISSPYGYRGSEFHTGIDIAKSSGSPVYASNGGTVTFAGWSGGYGNLVIINHGGGIETYYAHNSSITVSVGEQVQKGQQIARAGSTGRASGSHVHFEIRINGSSVNPLNYLNK
ncbi:MULTISPECIES: peptidoglycan DD-metalloendopeptidase family protein [Tepidanaerobacter]|uniref:Murein DD-endopeptidase MepM and murein hydrolase activator NlpD n=1 Tax=Tepidanaerobacter syntrophicus TaxID=224999 RepID=A0A0U9HDX9_9FIRM|nr:MULTISPECIES: peptidoglycan DD-metalloendopeptidase family protein [Tepidanaerobacter]GAQ24893.1 murein DD-endopeptidase MepM and murein hydrolase activator NlpD [Tepidanaerobacter syntrophicus]GLI18840.1 peptidase M23 [Tepidanaerobacter syntrophicus]GLI51304.1 peptidase M23 [Tepidanaerobacter syntrophicus]